MYPASLDTSIQPYLPYNAAALTQPPYWPGVGQSNGGVGGGANDPNQLFSNNNPPQPLRLGGGHTALDEPMRIMFNSNVSLHRDRLLIVVE